MNKTTTRKRRHEISLLNVIFCLLVIFIHIISYAVSHFAPGSLNYNFAMFPWRFSSFVVQGFIMLSGIKLFLTGKDTVPYKKWLIMRVKSIVIPYAVCFAVYYLHYYLYYDYPLDFIFIMKQFFSGSLVAHLYFIPLILQFDLLLPLWKKIVNNCSPVIVIPFCIVLSSVFEAGFVQIVAGIFPDIQFIYNDRLFTTYLSFYIIGCYIGKNYDSFLTILKNNFKTVAVCFAIAVLLFVYFTYLTYNSLAFVPFMAYVHSLYILCVLLFTYCLSLKWAPFLMEKIKFLQKTDAASFDIYLWHMLVLFGANFILEKLGIVSQIYAFVIRAVIVYPVTISACIFINSLKRKLKCLLSK